MTDEKEDVAAIKPRKSVRINTNVETIPPQNLHQSPSKRGSMKARHQALLDAALTSTAESRTSLRSGKADSKISYDKLIRPLGESRAMRTIERLSKVAWRYITCNCWRGKSEISHDLGESGQYSIRQRDEVADRFHIASSTVFWAHPFQSLMVWLFTTTFIKLFAAFLIFYFAFIYIFTFLILLLVVIGYHSRSFECVEGFDFENEKRMMANWEVMFELSWTTFSTVGYGTTSVPDDQDCQELRYLLTGEAFLGVLFSGFCAAVFYNKIQRLQSRARVTFSSAICLRYGSGLCPSVLDALPSNEFPEDDIRDSDKICHYPILEFRCVNDRACVHGKGHEIIESRLRVMISTIETTDEFHHGESDSCADLLSPDSHRGVVSESSHDSSRDKDLGGDTPRQRLGRLISGDSAASESSLQRLKKRSSRILSVAPDDNPFFSKGIWYFRHILDHKSPLLQSQIRHRISRLGGWPADIDTHEKVRSCISDKVQEIFLTLNGLSTITADSVFINHTYSLSDIYVGWRFAGMIYIPERQSRKNIFGVGIDLALLHDILPQEGGGEEPLGKRVTAG